MGAEGDAQVRFLVQVHEITQGIALGFGATVTVVGLNTPKGATTVRKVATAVKVGLSGLGIKIAAAELKAISSVTKGVKATAKGGAKLAGKGAKGVGKAAVAAGTVTFQAARSGKLLKGLIFVDRVATGVKTAAAIKREKEEGGDISQVIAAGAVAFVTGITFVDLVLPEGADTTFRDPATGNLIVPGGIEGFVTQRTFVDVVGEAVRLLVFS